MQSKKAIALLSRIPQIHRGSSDEPFAALPWDELDTLFTAMLGDLVEVACESNAGDVILYRDTKELSDDIFARFRGKLQLRDLPQGSYAEQVQQVVENVFGQRYDRLVLLLENNPLISPLKLRSIFQQLEYEDECLVIGPTVEGRCTFLGMKSNHGGIFSSEEGNPLEVQNILMSRLCASDAFLFPLPVGYSLDSGVNLARLKRDIEESVGTGTFPHRTLEIFKMLDKKYKPKKIAS